MARQVGSIAYHVIATLTYTRGREWDIPGGESYASIFYILYSIEVVFMGASPQTPRPHYVRRL